MDSTQDSVITYWNHPGCVDGYDSPLRPGFDRAAYEAAWRSELEQRVPAAPAEVLDLGSGTGFLSLLLAELGHRVRGVDLADNMLDLARRKATARGLDITFEKGDAQAPPGEPASVDAITSRYLFWTLDDPAALLAAAARLIRPGGVLIVFDGIWFPRGWDPAAFSDRTWYDIWIAQYSPSVRRSLPLLERNNADKVVHLVAEAGFVDIRATRLDHIERIVTAAVGEADPDGSENYAVWARKPPALHGQERR
ncbi:MAG: class I SAM-dependent methyltransferase [Pseudonocardiaceae bacterium]